MSDADFDRKVAALIALGMSCEEAEAQVGFDTAGGDVSIVGEDGISRPRHGRSSIADRALAALHLQLQTDPATVESAEATPVGRTGVA